MDSTGGCFFVGGEGGEIAVKAELVIMSKKFHHYNIYSLVVYV